MAETTARKKPGPPKTKDYTTFSLKLPTLLLDQIKRYAQQHRQSVSELFREGVEWRIGEGDPLGQRYATGDSAEHEHPGNPEIPNWMNRDSEPGGALEEIRHTLARQETQLQALTQALENRPGISMPSEYLDTIMEALIRRQSTPEPVQAGNGQHAPQEVSVESGNTGLQGSTQQPDKQDKAALVARLHQMRASEMSLKAIADQLQAEGVPTLSGKGQWQKGTVDKLLRSQTQIT
jgi:hypothetical protein